MTYSDVQISIQKKHKVVRCEPYRIPVTMKNIEVFQGAG